MPATLTALSGSKQAAPLGCWDDRDIAKLKSTGGLKVRFELVYQFR
jgi:hypothetical protein